MKNTELYITQYDFMLSSEHQVTNNMQASLELDDTMKAGSRTNEISLAAGQGHEQKQQRMLATDSIIGFSYLFGCFDIQTACFVFGGSIAH